MDSYYEHFVSETPPPAPADAKTGYPSNGNPTLGVPATVPGAYFFHMVTQEILNVIKRANITPDPTKLTQLSEAISMLIASVGGISAATAATDMANGEAGSATYAASNNTTAFDLAATPAGVASQISTALGPVKTTADNAATAAATAQSNAAAAKTTADNAALAANSASGTANNDFYSAAVLGWVTTQAGHYNLNSATGLRFYRPNGGYQDVTTAYTTNCNCDCQY